MKQARENKQPLEALLEQVFPLISDTTEIALDFNDNYGEIDSNNHLNQFDRDLSALGEAIELRMEFEDQLLHHLEKHEAL